jgi:hypothetical protein
VKRSVVALAAVCLLLAADNGPTALHASTFGSAAATTASSSRWLPRPGVTWQWQLDGRVDVTVPAAIYDVDGFETSATLVRRLHRLGRKVICYIDAGAYESYRPDSDRFPAVVLGKPDLPWPGERWLDIRRLDLLAPIMIDRLKMCAKKGFDGVELDEIDGYTNDTGFPLTARDQLRYNRFVARETRRLGLAAGLKNDVEQVRELVGDFDFAVNEQCFEYRECRLLLPFIKRHKAVLHVEYRVPAGRFCPVTSRLGFSSMQKHLDLGRWRRPC